MYYKRSIDHLIRARFSCRIYEEKRIEDEKINQLKKACAMLNQGLAGEKVTFQVVELSDREIIEIDPDDFSLIINPMTFIAGAIQKSKLAYESYGYLMEYLVLKATELGLGTCWLGYFNKSFFKQMKLAKDEIFPAICVVGYPGEKGSFSTRKKWERLFFIRDFTIPMTRGLAGNYAEALELLRLAPSSGNTQPWRVVKETNNDTFHFYKKSVDRHYEKRRLHNIDVGIAMCHFELGAGKNDLEGQWERVRQTISPIPARTEYIISWIGSKNCVS